jgi:hypothetical protein
MAMPVIIAILLLGCCLLAAACANLRPEQPRTLMPEVAEACADQFPDIEVKDVTAFGRLSLTGFWNCLGLYPMGPMSMWLQGWANCRAPGILAVFLPHDTIP